jgi:hypothetical protein
MKRKLPGADPIIDQQLLENAKRALQGDTLKRIQKCEVCGAACAPNSTENLCWVCRRLKISAWRDNDSQGVQE